MQYQKCFFICATKIIIQVDFLIASYKFCFGQRPTTQEDESEKNDDSFSFCEMNTKTNALRLPIQHLFYFYGPIASFDPRL